ncbi:hypothetical protein F4819DRAFT_458009 [Hypoxylon fuscum]|nr:hypothetical protein F4819DRAFT_458009 [Hypoxylon fuscum]
MRSSELFLALTSLFALAHSSEEFGRPKRNLEPLEPWKVTKMSTFSPSGRPGSSPLAHTWANITSSGSIAAGHGASFESSDANCTAEWVWASEVPYNHTYECTTTTAVAPSQSSSSTWTIEILEVTNSNYFSPTENFDVKFTLTSNVTVDGNEYYKVLVGTQHFEVGKNMRGTCGGSGLCSWALRDENNPVLVQPTIVACEGTC